MFQLYQGEHDRKTQRGVDRACSRIGATYRRPRPRDSPSGSFRQPDGTRFPMVCQLVKGAEPIGGQLSEVRCRDLVAAPLDKPVQLAVAQHRRKP